MLRFDVLTLFPEMFTSFLGEGLIKRALQQSLLDVSLYNYRQHGLGKHHHVDDTPYGGGPGMVLRVEPIFEALRVRETHYQEHNLQTHKILLTPQGQPLNQEKARILSQSDKVILLLCGRYEGFDERIRSRMDEEISGGDFICLGGEVIAMLMIEAISRLRPGVLGNQQSSEEESFAQGLLEYPQYTRPAEFENLTVPEVLLSGNHQEIATWRKEQALQRTIRRRPDLINNS